MAKFDAVDMRMTPDEREAFLAGARYAVVAVPTDGGAPILTPVWYAYEPGGEIVFTCEEHGEKAPHLKVGARVSLNVQHTGTQPVTPEEWVKTSSSYVTVEGVVTAVDAEHGQEKLHRLAQRYVGPDWAEVWRNPPAGAHTLAIHVRPERWLSRDYGKLKAALQSRG